MKVKIIDIEQGTPAWLELRKEYFRTASRTPVVMGLSPFSTKEKLAMELKFNAKPFVSKKMKMGNLLEDMIRLKANKILNDVFEPKVGLNGDFLASLDGINFEGDTIIEIKVSEKTYEDLKNGIIPKHYYAQIQHQLMVFNEAKKAYLIAYSTEKDDIIISEAIEQDILFQNTIVTFWNKFSIFVELFEKPSEMDILDKEVNDKMSEILQMQRDFKELEDKIKKAKEDLLNSITNKEDYKKINFVGGLIEIRKGAKRANYKKYIEDKGLTIDDEYYTESAPSYVFKENKGKDNE